MFKWPPYDVCVDVEVKSATCQPFEYLDFSFEVYTMAKNKGLKIISFFFNATI